MAMWVLKKFRFVILIWHQHHVDFHQRHVESPRVAWSCQEWPGVMLIFINVMLIFINVMLIFINMAA